MQSAWEWVATTTAHASARARLSATLPARGSARPSTGVSTSAASPSETTTRPLAGTRPIVLRSPGRRREARPRSPAARPRDPLRSPRLGLGVSGHSPGADVASAPRPDRPTQQGETAPDRQRRRARLLIIFLSACGPEARPAPARSAMLRTAVGGGKELRDGRPMNHPSHPESAPASSGWLDANAPACSPADWPRSSGSWCSSAGSGPASASSPTSRTSSSSRPSSAWEPAPS